MADEEEEEFDEQVTMVVDFFKFLDKEQMKAALELMKEEFKNKKKEDLPPIPPDVLATLAGNSAEKIAELEKEYDFTGVPVKMCEEAKKWYKAIKPTSTRKFGPEVYSAYHQWAKWNTTEKTVPKKDHKSHLIKTRDEAMAAVGAAMAAVRLD